MIQFESGQTPPSEWQRDDYRIVETWRVYDPTNNSLYCYLSPIHGAQIHSADAIAEVGKHYCGDFPVSAELIRWSETNAQSR